MKQVIKKSYVRVIEPADLDGYNRQWKPERQTNRGLPGKNQLVALLFIGIIVLVLTLGVFQQASANRQVIGTGSPAQMPAERVSPANGIVETGGVQGDHQTYESAQPGIWYGLAASLAGALVMGMSFLVLQRQKA